MAQLIRVAGIQRRSGRVVKELYLRGGVREREAKCSV